MLARDLHPGAWWTWALGVAVAVSTTTNPWLLLLLVLVVCFVVIARRTEAPWALSFRLYLCLALFIVTTRVLFRIIFGGGLGGEELFSLPQIPLPAAARGIELLGPVTQQDLLGGLYDGMRLAAMILCVGAANTLANPKRLLKSLPPALYEIGTALVVALSMFPQLAESTQRVRRARRLRGDPGRGVGALKRIVVPVLEDALERSMTLAEGMDARGYGRRGTATSRERAVTGVLLIGALIGLSVGTYALLDETWADWVATAMVVGGAVLAVVGTVVAGRRVERTRYRPDRWRTGELVAASSGVALAASFIAIREYDAFQLVPNLLELPTVSVLPLAAAMIGLVPAFFTPPPVLDGKVRA